MSDNQRPRFPPLRIGDLLVLTLTISAALALLTPGMRDLMRMSDSELHVPKVRMITWTVLEQIAVGIGLFGLIVLARERLKRNDPDSPGHFVLLATAPLNVLLLVTNIIPSRHLANAVNVLPIAACSYFAVRGFRRIPEWPWRLCYAMLLVWLIAVACYMATQSAAYLGHSRSWRWMTHAAMTKNGALILASGICLLAVAADFLKGIRRDWLHYMAVASLALFGGSTLLYYAEQLYPWLQSLSG